MTLSLLERLVENRHRWLIVTGVTLAIFLVTGLPQVDQYLAARSERSSLEEQIARASETVELLPDRELLVEQEVAKLEELRQRQVDESSAADLRSWLVDAARQAGCQVRRIDIGKPRERRWSYEDKPTNLEPTDVSKKKLTPFNLQTRQVTFSVMGSSNEIRSLLKTIDQDNRLKHTHTIDLRPEGRGRQIQLDLTLWYYALVRPADVA